MEALSTTSGIDQFALPRAREEAAEGSLGQEDFLRLMITQFQNQDPMEPMQNGEFLGQMAQFSTVAGIGDMSESVDSLAASIHASQAMQAAAIVGREVLISSTTGRLEEDGSLRGAVDVPEDAAGVRVRVLNAEGELVRSLDLGPRPAGHAGFEWDGTTANGEAAAPGHYRILADVSNGRSTISAPTLMSVRVDTVSIGDNGTAASVTTADGRQLPMSAVRGISNGG